MKAGLFCPVWLLMPLDFCTWELVAFGADPCIGVSSVRLPADPPAKPCPPWELQDLFPTVLSSTSASVFATHV